MFRYVYICWHEITYTMPPGSCCIEMLPDIRYCCIRLWLSTAKVNMTVKNTWTAPMLKIF